MTATNLIFGNLMERRFTLHGYSEKRLKGCSANTLRLYRHSIKSFEKTLGRPATTDDLTDDNMHKHMWRLVDEGRSRATANKDCAQIGAMWRFANRNGIVSNWPNTRLLQEPERVPMAWLPDEIDRLFDAIEREPGFVCGVPARLWWKCLVNVLLETGERIKPIRELERTAVSGEYIKVRAELRKRMTRDKMYKLTKSTAADVQQILSLHREPRLFPWVSKKWLTTNRSAGTFASC